MAKGMLVDRIDRSQGAGVGRSLGTGKNLGKKMSGWVSLSSQVR